MYFDITILLLAKILIQLYVPLQIHLILIIKDISKMLIK